MYRNFITKVIIYLHQFSLSNLRFDFFSFAIDWSHYCVNSCRACFANDLLSFWIWASSIIFYQNFAKLTQSFESITPYYSCVQYLCLNIRYMVWWLQKTKHIRRLPLFTMERSEFNRKVNSILKASCSDYVIGFSSFFRVQKRHTYYFYFILFISLKFFAYFKNPSS